MGAIKDLWQSERGLVAVALILASTVLFATGHISVDQWTDLTKWVFVTYAAAKTVTGAVALASARARSPVSESFVNMISEILRSMYAPQQSAQSDMDAVAAKVAASMWPATAAPATAGAPPGPAGDVPTPVPKGS